LTTQWEPAESTPNTQLPGRTAVLVAPGTEGLATRLAATLPGAEVLTPEQLAADTRGDRFDAVVDLAGCADPGEPADHSRLTTWVSWLQRAVDSQRELTALLVSRGTAAGRGGAARAGLYRMLQSEYRHMRSRQVEMGDATDEQLCRWVADELQTGDSPGRIGYRDGIRHQARL
ncbi:hypothetical protein AB4212_70485, partial [Streptomyces sp. 2MCAF27]